VVCNISILLISLIGLRVRMSSKMIRLRKLLKGGSMELLLLLVSLIIDLLLMLVICNTLVLILKNYLITLEINLTPVEVLKGIRLRGMRWFCKVSS